MPCTASAEQEGGEKQLWNGMKKGPLKSFCPGCQVHYHPLITPGTDDPPALPRIKSGVKQRQSKNKSGQTYKVVHIYKVHFCQDFSVIKVFALP